MKRFRDKSLLFFFIAALLLFITSCVVLLFVHRADLALVVSLGFVTSFISLVYSYLSIRNAFTASARTFYKKIFGSMLLRFALFIITLFLIYRFTKFSVYGFILAFFVFYLMFQIIEIRLVTTEVKKHQHD